MALVSLAAVALLGVGAAAAEVIDRPASQQVQAAAASTTTASNEGPTSPLVPGSDDEPVAQVAAALGPSVVVIKNSEGLGSGVIYDSSGLIITNAHVVGTAEQVNVTLGDGQTLEGTVLGADTSHDIAVVRVSPTSELTAARLADQPAQVGQLAVAVGSPFGLDHTVTAGVVSAVNRPVDNNDGIVANMIQTDAPINPGNSGGALANRHGEVIGINTMIYSQSGENNGIGFAIPIDQAKALADKLANGESPDRAYLGVSSKASTDGQPGAVVQEVQAGSAAEAAGLEVGDVVTAVDGTAVKESGDLAALIGTHSGGDTITLTIQRDGQEQELKVELGSKTGQSTGSSQDPSQGQASPRTPQTR